MTTRRLGLLFGRSDGLGVSYRRPRLKPDGPATAEAVTAALVSLARQPGGGVAFGAGHGSPANDESPAALELWGGPLDVRTLARALDEGASKGPLVLVLGHCHSGAFAHLAFVGGDPNQPLASPPRCVLAAAPPDREASGCSPDADDPGSKAFIRTFVLGLQGAGDFDGDGRVSLSEAFAFAKIHDPTIDVPVRSSEQWLLGQPGPLSHQDDAARPFLSGDASPTLESLLTAATTAERTMVRSMFPDGRLDEIAEALHRLDEEAERLDEASERAEEIFEERRWDALEPLLAAWPELNHPFHPRSRDLLAAGAPDVMTFLARRPSAWAAFEEANRGWTKISDDRWEVERRRARLERWMRTVTSLFYRRQLSPEQGRAWKLLRDCEDQVPTADLPRGNP